MSGALTSGRLAPHAAGDALAGTIAIGVGATPGKASYQPVVRGMQLAIERLNADAPDGTRFALRTLDAGPAGGAVQIAQQLRDDPAVIAVVGHPESGATLEAIPVYADVEHAGANAVALLSPTASSPSLTGINRWFFRLAPSDEETARLVAHYVSDSLGLHSAAIVYRNDSYGREWAARFSGVFAASHGTTLAAIPYITGVTEWTAYALELKALAPEVLLFPGDVDDALAMLRALKTAGVTLAFIGGDGTAAVGNSGEFPDARFTAFFLPQRATTDEGTRFVSAYTARFAEAPSTFAALAYDATLAIGRVVQSGARNRSDVRNALERLAGATAIDGAAGAIAFNRQHDALGRTVVIATAASGRR